MPDDPLVMRMPFDLSGASAATLGNSPIDGQIRIPVQLDDPIEVLTNLHTATERMNTVHRRDAQRIIPEDPMGVGLVQGRDVTRPRGPQVF